MNKLRQILSVFRRPKWRFGAYSTLVMGMLIAIGVFVNIAIESLEASYGWRKDYSFNGYTATSEETEAALDTLSMPVTLYLLYQSNEMDSALYEVLMHYHYLSNLITVTPVDLTKNPGFITEFEGDMQSSVTADSVVVSCETTDRYRILNYEDFTTQGYNIDSGAFEIAGLAYEKKLTEALLYVTQTEVPVIGISQGHGELSPGTLQTLIGFLQSNGYDIETVDLVAGDTPDGISLLLIADPYKDFSADEIETLKAYALEGGNFLVIRDYTDPTDLSNYQGLLRNYGVIPLPGIVVASAEDAGSYYGEPIYLRPYFNQMDMTLPLIASNTDTLLLAGAGAFKTPEQTDASLSAATVLKSGANAYLRDISTGNGSIGYQEGDITGELSLGHPFSTYASKRQHQPDVRHRQFHRVYRRIYVPAYLQSGIHPAINA